MKTVRKFYTCSSNHKFPAILSVPFPPINMEKFACGNYVDAHSNELFTIASLQYLDGNPPGYSLILVGMEKSEVQRGATLKDVPFKNAYSPLNSPFAFSSAFTALATVALTRCSTMRSTMALIAPSANYADCHGTSVATTMYTILAQLRFEAVAHEHRRETRRTVAMSTWSSILIIALFSCCSAACGALALGGQADLVIDQMTHSPDSPTTGSSVTFTVTVKNQGSGSTILPFSVSFWSNLSSAPTAATAAQQTQATTPLAAGASAQLTFTAIATAAGTYTAWAYADQAGLIAESNKSNNAGPLPAGHAWTVVPITITPPPNPTPNPTPTGTPPAITSPLSATGNSGVAFSYTITASGTTPMTFNATNLPQGLSFSAATISGTPSANGAFTIALSASNSAGSDSETLNLVIQSAAGAGGTGGGQSENAGPQLVSLPTITPNPAVVGQSVQFSAAASDANGDALAFTWEFGDGTNGTGASVSHTYAAPGLYNASVTVTDGIASVSAGISVGVNPQPASGGITGPQPIPFAVQKAMLKMNLKSTRKDSLTLSGVLPVQNFSPANKTVQAVIGSLNRAFQLDAHAKGGDASNSLRLSGKLKNGVFAGSSVKFMLTLKKQTLSTSFGKFVFPGVKNNSILNIPVVISTTGNDWEVDYVKFDYNPLTGSATQIGGR